MVRLNEDDYKRPELTLTDQLSHDDIKEKLKGYKRVNTVDELEQISLGTHIRYFDYKDDEYLFRTGGILLNKKGIPDYIVLGNGKKSWCVQIKTCAFFKQMNNNEIKTEYAEVLETQVKKISELKKKLTKKIVKYKVSDIKGELVDPDSVEKGDLIIPANKRIKKIYEPMVVYDIEYIGNIKSGVKTVNLKYEKFVFNMDDYYFYTYTPEKNEPISKVLNKFKKFVNIPNK
jgi:hypothetical protein